MYMYMCTDTDTCKTVMMQAMRFNYMHCRILGDGAEYIHLSQTHVGGICDVITVW